MTLVEASQVVEGVEAALRHVKPQVRGLSAYTLRHVEAPIKLNQNENPYDVPAELKARLWGVLADRSWSRYPPFVASDFISAVAEATGWSEDGILVGNGSNELIQALIAATIGPERSVVIPEPTFTLYRLLTGVNGGTSVPVSLDDELGFRVPAIIAAAREADATMIVLCTPNNPTGGVLTRSEIEAIHDGTDALIVLDQAYVEFGGYDAIPLLADRPRMIILRTFSKAMGLAGLRAGYLLGHPELVREVAKAKLPYNLNFITESIAAAVLRNRELLAPSITTIRAQRDRLVTELSAFPSVRVFPTFANFVLFRLLPDSPLDHRSVYQRLLEEYGVLIRDVSGYPMLAGCLRVSVGTPEENTVFLRAMAALMPAAEARSR